MGQHFDRQRPLWGKSSADHGLHVAACPYSVT